MRKNMEMRPLPCELSDEEVEAKARELGRVAMDAEDTEDAISAAAENYKSTKRQLQEVLADIAGRRRSLAEQVTSRTVSRDVRCFWRYDLASGAKYLVREDSGRAVAFEKIQDDERQLLLGEKIEEEDREQLAVWAMQVAEAESRIAREDQRDGRHGLSDSDRE